MFKQSIIKHTYLLSIKLLYAEYTSIALSRWHTIKEGETFL